MQLSQTAKMALAVLNALDNQIAVVNREGRILYVNQAWIEFGRSNGMVMDPKDWEGVNYLRACQSVDSKGAARLADASQMGQGLRAVLDAQQQTFACEYPCLGPDGQHWYRMSVQPLGEQSGHFLISHQSVTAQKIAEQRHALQQAELEKAASTDRLTQLYNRLRLDDALAKEVERAKRYGTGFAVIIFDIDHFKSINDSFGHQIGDAVLRQIAQLLQEGSRKTDVVGRWGGEEFLIVLPESHAEAACLVAEKLRASVAAHPFPLTGTVTCSYGVAEYHEGQNAISLVDCADAALYRAKRAGRNCGHVDDGSGQSGFGLLTSPWVAK